MSSEVNKKKILVVDDDPVQVKLLEERLMDEGFDILTSTQAAAGLQIAMTERPDIIILDVMMPVINGYNFCHLLKSDAGKKHIPIILLTSRDDHEDIKIGMDMGANAYLTKPVDFDELFKAIKSCETMEI